MTISRASRANSPPERRGDSPSHDLAGVRVDDKGHVAYGAKGARIEIAAIKVAAPTMATQVIDRAIEVFGGQGVSDDTPLAYLYAWARALRIVDGPDAVHRESIARQELRRERPYVG